DVTAYMDRRLALLPWTPIAPRWFPNLAIKTEVQFGCPDRELTSLCQFAKPNLCSLGVRAFGVPCDPLMWNPFVLSVQDQGSKVVTTSRTRARLVRSQLIPHREAKGQS